ncbi:hypothetical protein HBI23_172820 [Parastagonospora nodorum]|nr:hypothetical protein HBI47_159430 [Parastagonospora nodorum]KAH5649207.1 hypothetical protein HBI23_172820 [Parastagonospora nodorum]KAH6055527.1 hypothetical protein HBI67_193850 [Parastagonospora nodorum]KAH6064605.1 hypothetical protein HBI66_170200 [Parastagonospora nodorum]
MVSPATTRDRLNSDEAEVNGKERSSEEQGQSNGYRQDASLTEEKDKKEKKPGFIKRTWTKLGLDAPTVMMMCKAALPPTIALAMNQSTAVAKVYATLGYLVAIISILGFCIMPRAKFIQTMTMNVLGTCIGSAIAMLMVWSGVKAREHTTTPGAPPERYNSSQSAVLGVWLFFQIWAINTVKAKFPQLAFPTIIYAIQVNVAATNGFLFRTTAQCETFILRLLEAFLTGFGLATGVSLFIIPVTSRKVVMKEVTGYIGLLRGTLGAHKTYIHSLEDSDMFGKTYVPESKDKNKDAKPKLKPEIQNIKKMIGSIQELHGKLTADLPFAKREIAYGKLTPDDLETIFKKLRGILMPVLGLGSVMDLFERGAELSNWAEEDEEGSEHEAERKKAVREWNDMFKYLHGPFADIFQALDDGLAHVLLRLGLAPQPKKKKGVKKEDEEAHGDTIRPGDEGFAAHLEKQASIFFGKKEPTLRHWMQSKGISIRSDYFSTSEGLDDEALKRLPSLTTRKRDQSQLYVLLYVMFLLNSIARSTLEFVKFADEHDQTKAKSKIMWPGGKRLKKWIKSIFSDQDANQGDETTIAGYDGSNTTVYMGDAYKKKKDPEHLPPANAWEKFGNSVRGISHFLRSDESSFGFRAACATMSIAIIAFLKDTQTFFVEQRLVWALIMVAISMTPTAGQSVFQFVLRIVGTAIAMVFAWLMWYIPGQHTAGILVFVFVFVAIGFYVPLKRFDLVIAGLISVVTAVMIVGYELQVRVLGVQAATATTGQPAYPIYQLGPYRLATVVGGLAVAFFWTIFPFPITEHSALRQKLGGSLYLSANLYSIVHEQVMSRIRGDAGDEENDKKSPGYALNKVRNKVFAKQMLTLQGLKMHAQFVKWEFPLGGKFPMEQYEEIVGYVTNIVNYTALTGYASATFTHPALNPSTSDKPYPSDGSPPASNPNPMLSPTSPFTVSPQWFNDFRRLSTSTNVTSHEITSLLALLSSSISSGQPLPPYLTAPEGFQLSKRLDAVDHDILSLRHIAEPGYAAFAVMAISTRCIHMDLQRLLEGVRKLVGELDFSFHVVSTDHGSGSEETLVKGRNKQD